MNVSDLAELTHDHDGRHAGQVANEYGSREKFGDKAEPQQPGDHAEDAEQEGQLSREPGVSAGIPGGHGTHDRGGQQRFDGGGTGGIRLPDRPVRMREDYNTSNDCGP